VSLHVVGVKATLELAPVLRALQRLAWGEVSDGHLAHFTGINLSGQAGVPAIGFGDVVTNAESQCLRYSIHRPDLRTLMTVTEGHYRIIARRSAGIEAVGDLKGKRVATRPWASAGFYLYRALQDAGLTESDVTSVPLPVASDFSVPLLSGDADALVIWEPYAQQVFEQLGDDAVALSPPVYREFFNLYSSTEKLDDPVKRALIVQFVREIVAAAAEIRETPRIGIALVAGASGHDAALVARAWEHHSFSARVCPDLLDVMDAEERWSCRETSRPPRSRAELARLIDTSVFDEAASGVLTRIDNG
jgi:NitT/TauT family transport system substrate-binding protein